MARSRKKPYYKDKGYRKNDYWKTIRREWNQTLQNWKQGTDLVFRQPKEIINDWDYCDYHYVYYISKESCMMSGRIVELGHTKEDIERASRK